MDGEGFDGVESAAGGETSVCGGGGHGNGGGDRETAGSAAETTPSCWGTEQGVSQSSSHGLVKMKKKKKKHEWNQLRVLEVSFVKPFFSLSLWFGLDWV